MLKKWTKQFFRRNCFFATSVQLIPLQLIILQKSGWVMQKTSTNLWSSETVPSLGDKSPKIVSMSWSEQPVTFVEMATPTQMEDQLHGSICNSASNCMEGHMMFSLHAMPMAAMTGSVSMEPTQKTVAIKTALVLTTSAALRGIDISTRSSDINILQQFCQGQKSNLWWQNDLWKWALVLLDCASSQFQEGAFEMTSFLFLIVCHNGSHHSSPFIDCTFWNSWNVKNNCEILL